MLNYGGAHVAAGRTANGRTLDVHVIKFAYDVRNDVASSR